MGTLYLLLVGTVIHLPASARGHPLLCYYTLMIVISGPSFQDMIGSWHLAATCDCELGLPFVCYSIFVGVN